jgi:hypothetical protein
MYKGLCFSTSISKEFPRDGREKIRFQTRQHPKHQGGKGKMSVGKFVCLGVLLITVGCLQDAPMDSSKAKGTKASVQDTQIVVDPAQPDEDRVFLMAADKTAVACGENVAIAEILFDPTDKVCPTSCDHSIYQTHIPSRPEVIKELDTFMKAAKKGATCADFKKTQRPGECIRDIISEYMTGWTDYEGGPGFGQIAPHVFIHAYEVQFKMPGSYILHSEWEFSEKGKDQKLQANLLIWVKDATGKSSDFSPQILTEWAEKAESQKKTEKKRKR